MGASRSSQNPERIGRFEVRRSLGTGGMGIVYAAHDPALDREVAVKLLRRDRFRADQLALAGERLHHEAQVTAKLAHPNVVTIFDVGPHDDSVYIAMELVDGPSLYQWMASTARPWREVLTMFFHAGRGLAAAHGVGLVHRDFKPANVLIGSDLRPRVVDFGLAHFGAVPAERVSVPEGSALGTLPGMDLAGDADSVVTTIGDGPGWGDDAGASFVDGSGQRDMLGTHPGDSLVRTHVDVTNTHPGESIGGRGDVLGTSPGDSLVRDRPDLASSGSCSAGEVSLVDGTILQSRSITGGFGRTATGLFVGTPAYMAPELFTGAGADARTDQFAFCVSLYEGLYGERPFAGETAREIAESVTEGRVQPAPPRTRVPGWLRNIVVRGLAVRPDERHESLKSMLAAIAFTSRIWE
ncbi:MAG TPA: serine/threonine-protein kinase [Nannocystaceae bacterium]|nr:serine/threonine-protein kinase [Nannocystaceae bacterium]